MRWGGCIKSFYSNYNSFNYLIVFKPLRSKQQDRYNKSKYFNKPELISIYFLLFKSRKTKKAGNNTGYVLKENVFIS